MAPLDLPKFLVENTLYATRLSVQVPTFAGGLHPRFIEGL